MKKRILFIILYLTAVSLSAKNRQVLLINSYNQEMQWVKGITESVKDVLEPEKNNIVLHIENMDSKQFHSDKYFDSFYDFISVKYQETDFSLIMVSDNNAFNFILTHHKTLFPAIPVVFCGVNNFKDSMIYNHNGFTGVKEVFSVENTLKTALLLHPDTEEVFIINDYLLTGRTWESEMRDKFSRFKENVKIRYSENLPIKDLQKEIKELKRIL